MNRPSHVRSLLLVHMGGGQTLVIAIAKSVKNRKIMPINSFLPTKALSFPCANRAQLLHLVGVLVYRGLLSTLVREHE